MRPLVRFAVVVTIAYGSAAGGQDRKTRDQLVQEDRASVQGEGFWIYNDLALARTVAQQSAKPLLVVFRCIPCDACAQLDSEIVERDPTVRDLLKKFVCLRIVHANGMDLSLFQFDYDQSFAAFFLNADKTIYGRYGTRSHQTESADDVSLEGFAKALEAALELHDAYPENRSDLAGKQPQDTPKYSVPEQYPQLEGKYESTIRYEKNVAQSCIHCHQVAELQRDVPHGAGEAIPDKVLFPYPHPKVLGLIMDPKQKATIKRVVPGSPAELGGFQQGDEILSLGGQPQLSIADTQWVLHHGPGEGQIPAVLLRHGTKESRQLTLENGWRRQDDLSWRASSWALRRMTTGGLVLEHVPLSELSGTGLDGQTMALRVRHVGQFGPHALAQRAGFRQHDIVVSVDGLTTPMRETDLMAYLVNSKRVGEKVPVTVLRDGTRLGLTLTMQE